MKIYSREKELKRTESSRLNDFKAKAAALNIPIEVHSDEDNLAEIQKERDQFKDACENQLDAMNDLKHRGDDLVKENEALKDAIIRLQDEKDKLILENKSLKNKMKQLEKLKELI